MDRLPSVHPAPHLTCCMTLGSILSCSGLLAPLETRRASWDPSHSDIEGLPSWQPVLLTPNAQEVPSHGGLERSPPWSWGRLGTVPASLATAPVCVCDSLCCPSPALSPCCLCLSVPTGVPFRKSAHSAPARRMSCCWCCTEGTSWTQARGTHPVRPPTSPPSAPCWSRSHVPTSLRPWATSSSSLSPVLPSALRLSRWSPSESLSACWDWMALAVGGLSGGAVPAMWVPGGQGGTCPASLTTGVTGGKWSARCH